MQKPLKFLLNRIVRCFVAGTLCILPVVLTIAVVLWMGNLLWQYLGPGTLIGEGLSKLGLRFVTNATVAYAIGTLLVVAVVFCIGVVVEAGARDFLQKSIDATMCRIPLLGNLYGTSKQLVGMFDKNDPEKLQGMKAVLCHFGESCTILGLLVSSNRYRINGRDYQGVIIPTAPVPIGGGLFFMPVESIELADMSIDGLMSIYVSMGITAAQFLPGPVVAASQEI